MQIPNLKKAKMRPPKQYQKGETIGDNGITYVVELESRNHIRRARVKCNCGMIFTTQISSLKNGHTKSCGCAGNIRNTTHGMHKTPMYKEWDNIKTRTGNSNTPYFKNYGDRGIIMFPPWIYDFQLFYDYVSCLPNFREKGYTLDRINNDGNYEPCNLRWTTYHVQLSNKRKSDKNTSGYTGVAWYKNAWTSQIGFMKKNIYLGRFKTKEQAVTARNNYIIANNLSEYKIQDVK
jgi:hypothetical protein